MDKKEILIQMNELMSKHDVYASVRFSKRLTTAYGQTNASTLISTGVITLKEIVLGESLLVRTDDEIMNTLTHELAHAILLQNQVNCGHSKQWKELHISLGGTGHTRSR